jgi:Ca-activated chloride channel family protein
VITFRDPQFLLVLLVVPIVVIGEFLRKPAGHVRFSSLRVLREIRQPVSLKLRRFVPLFSAVAIALFSLGLARPQKGIEYTSVTTEGIDIELVVDVSGSMRALDFEIEGERRDRLYVTKQVLSEFIEGRIGDRMGLVVFAGLPYTQCPLTLDYGAVLSLLERAEIGMVEDGTAIGSAIGTAVMRLRESDAESRVMILLTDGINNAGKVSPDTAANLAKESGIKIYAVGVGKKGLVPYPARDVFGRAVLQRVSMPVDDEGLTRIAETTGGRYWRATDTNALREIYAEIDKLERTEATVEKYAEYNELFPYFVMPGLGFLVIGSLLGNTRFARIP